MQYCTKCKNISDDKTLVCPYCKRTKALRQAKDGDSVFLMKTSEFEAAEIASLFEENAVKSEVLPFSMGLVSSIYDSEIMPTDKEIFVNYEHIDMAKVLLEKEYSETEIPEPIDDMSKSKRIIIQMVSVIAFLVVVSLVVFGADAIANAAKGLFSGLKA